MTPSPRKMKGEVGGAVVRAKARRNEKMSKLEEVGVYAIVVLCVLVFALALISVVDYTNYDYECIKAGYVTEIDILGTSYCVKFTDFKNNEIELLPFSELDDPQN